MHPIFSTVVTRPDLIVDHLCAYAALALGEARSTGTGLVRRAVAWGLAGLCMLMSVALAGIAVMLGVLQGQFHWVLVIVPGALLALGLLALAMARIPAPPRHFAELRNQFTADIGLLRAAGDHHDR